jgi:hypothetical protein
MNRSSKRFTPSWWTERLVPVLIAVLLVGLLATLTIICLSVLGFTPSF